MVLWQAVFLAASPLVTAPPSNLTRLYYNGSAAKSHSTTLQYRQLRRLYFKRSPVVASFPGDFQRIDSAHIRLQDGRHYSNKKSSNATEIVCSSFGLITTLLRRSSSESSEFISQLRDLLNIVDLSNISVDEENEREANKRPRASRRLEMPTTPTNKTSLSVAMTPPNSGNSQRAENKNVPQI